MFRTRAVVLATILSLSASAHTEAASPAIYHTIDGRFVSAYFTSQDGCLLTDVWVSASWALYAPQPTVRGDRLNRQGLTAVSITVYDTCRPLVGKHHPIVADWFAQTSDRLVTEPRMRGAMLNANLAMTDSESGASALVPVHLAWTATGRAHPDTVRNNHVRFVGEGVVNTHDNNLILSAVASGSVMLNGMNMAPQRDHGATLQQIKSSCMEIRYPHWSGDTLFCFGF